MQTVQKKTDTINTSTNGVSVFSFLDYRKFLQALYANLKESGTFFSYRYFSRVSGVSRSYLKLIMDGRRNLSPATITKFAKALKLNRKETAYFEALVLYNQADTDEERDRHFERALALKPRIEIEGLTPDQFEYLTKNHFVILREMSALPGFSDDPQWIAKNLRHPLKPREVKRALEVLERLGMLVRRPDGTLKHSGKVLETPLLAPSAEILNYHRQALSDSKEAILNAPFNEWDVGSMTIPMAEADIPKAMELMRKCREEIAAMINKGTRNFHEVFQVNMQLFPVTKVNQQREEKGKEDKEEKST